jgi:coproporphyrinogen III oxidase-like Fe-S oxidoreductase
MMGLRLTQGMVVDEETRPYIDEKKRVFATQQGLLVDDEKHLIATPKGRLVLTSLTGLLLNAD